MEKPGYKDLLAPMEPEQVPRQPEVRRDREVIVVGGGMAGLSAAIYLGRALRDVLLVDAGESLAMWEPEVQNYLGFQKIDGRELLQRGRRQATSYGAEFITEEIEQAERKGNRFRLRGKTCEFECGRLLLATGIYHLPPRVPEVNECIGVSMFFCKDCDGYRVQGKRVVVIGHNNEAVEYALGILTFTNCVTLLCNGEAPRWDAVHGKWVAKYQVPVSFARVAVVEQVKGQVRALVLEDERRIEVDSIFTTRGDIFLNQLARQLGAELDEDGQVVVDSCQRTSVPGLYAAGCITPANCQMIIAAGQGAAAAQAINRDLFEQSLKDGSLRRRREDQLRRAPPEDLSQPAEAAPH